MNRISFLLFSPLLLQAITFHELCERSYHASGELIQTQGQLDALPHLKASALAHNPLALELASSAIHGDDSVDSGGQYSAMVNWSPKKFGYQESTALIYEHQNRSLVMETELQRQQIQIILKREWYISLLEEERVRVLNDYVEASARAYASGQKKVEAGRMSQMELQRLAVELQSAKQALNVGKMEVDHIQESLKEMSMMNEPVVVEDMPFRFIAIEESALDEKVNHASVLQKLDAQIASLDATAKNAHYDGNDAYSIGVGATHEPTQQSIDVRFSVPLTFGDKNEQKIAALMRERSSLVHQRSITAQKLQMSVRALLEHLRFKEQRYSDALSAEKNGEKLLDLSRKGYEGGVMSQFEYLATQKSYYDAVLQSLELKRDYIHELANLEEKLGGIIE